MRVFNFDKIVFVPVDGEVITGTFTLLADLWLENVVPDYKLVLMFENKEAEDKFCTRYDYVVNLLGSFASVYFGDVIAANEVITITTVVKQNMYILVYKHAYMICSAVYFRDLLLGDTDYDTYFKRHNATLLGSPAFKAQEFYSKFSRTRIEALKPLCSNTCTYELTSENYKNPEDRFKIFSCNRFNYKRHYSHKLPKNMFIENVGRSLFECLLLGKEVYYDSSTKCMNDGLTYHLKYFCDFDDNNSGLLTAKDLNTSRLFFSDDKRMLPWLNAE